MVEGTLVAGWGRPLSSRKFHYFTADNPTEAICGKWGLFGGYRDQPERQGDEHCCAECTRRVDKLLAVGLGGEGKN